MDSYEWQLARDVQQAWKDGVDDAQAEQKANEDQKREAEQRAQAFLEMHRQGR